VDALAQQAHIAHLFPEGFLEAMVSARSMPILAQFWFSEKFLRLQNENETLQANFKAG